MGTVLIIYAFHMFKLKKKNTHIILCLPDFFFFWILLFYHICLVVHIVLDTDHNFQTWLLNSVWLSSLLYEYICAVGQITTHLIP